MEKITIEQRLENLEKENATLKKQFKTLAHFVFHLHFSQNKNQSQFDRAMTFKYRQTNKRKKDYGKDVPTEKHYDDCWKALNQASEQN